MNQEFEREFAIKLGSRLRAARHYRQLKTEELAIRASLNVHRLLEYESGRGRVTADELGRITYVLQLPIDHFFGQCVLCGADR